jgi:hypothetical protein
MKLQGREPTLEDAKTAVRENWNKWCVGEAFRDARRATEGAAPTVTASPHPVSASPTRGFEV